MKKVITALTATAAISTYGLTQDASADTSSVHPIVSGDTLWSIAKSNGLTVDQLKDFNNLSSDLIRAGSQLNLSNTSSTTAAPSTYTVKAGDTLWGIGNRHNVSVADLKKWNNLSSDLILVNQTLTLKDGAEKAEPKKTVKVETEETEAVVEEVQESADTYTVKPGDTLYRIATEHGMTYRTLMAINGLTDYVIYPGDVLKLKGGAQTEVVAEDEAPADEAAPVEEIDVVEEETATEEPAAVEAPVEETVVEEVEAEAPVQEEVDTVVEGGAPAETPAEEAVTEEVEEPAAVEAPVEETVVEAEEPAVEEAEEAPAVEEEVEAETPVIEEAPTEETVVEEDEEPAVEEAPAVEEEVEVEAPVAEEVPVQEEEAAVEEEPAVEEVEAEEPAVEEEPAQEEEVEAEEPAAEEAPEEVVEEEAPSVEEESAQEEVEETPAVEEEPAAEPAPSNITGDSYTVQSGDTLASIAKRAGMNYNDIMAYNEMDSVLIYPGLTLDLVDNRPAEPVQEEVSAPVEEEAVEETPEVVQPEPAPEPEVEEVVESEPVVEEVQEPEVQAPANPSASYGTNWYPHGECTWYAFERRKQLGKPASGSWGNAYNWANAARSQGLAVNNTPSVGAIIQSNAWSNGAYSFGHVGVVEQVNPDGSIMISEMNWSNGLGGKSFRTLSASQAANHNFIH